MPTPIIDALKDDSDLTMHTHTEADLGATLDNRYVNVTGDTMTGNLILNDNVSVLLGTGSDGELFHDGSNTYFQNNTGNIIIENDASDGDITFKVNDGGVDKTVMTLDGATGNVGIGTTAPGGALDVSYGFATGVPTLLLGADNGVGSRTRTNATIKVATQGFAHYTNAEEPIATFIQTSGSTYNAFALGGGTSYLNAVTQIQFFTAANTTTTTGTERMRIDSSGNVGIGTTSPTYKLDVSGTQRLTVDTGDVFVLNGTNVTGYTDLKFTGHGVDNFIYSFGSSYATSGRYIATSGLFDATGVGGLGLAASNASGVIRLYTNGNNERMRVDNAGNVGIGTTNPSSPLQVHGPSTGLVDILKISKAGGSTSYMSVFSNTSNSSNFDPSFLGFHGSGGSAALQFIGGMDAGNDSSGNSPLVSFQARRGGVSGSAVVSRDLFDFNNYGTSVMRINVSGYVGIGTTSPSGRLHINGTADDQQLIVEAHSTQTNNIVEIHDSSSNVLISFNGVGGAVFNEQGSATADFRVESDTEANMLFVDANANTDGSVYLGGTTNGIEIKKGGDLTLLGTAKYERHVQIPAMANGLPANQPAEVDFFTAGGLQFASAGAQYAYCQWEIPDDWDGTDIVFEIDWFPDSGAISGTDTIKWDVEYRSIAEGEAINNGTSVTVSVTDSTDYAQYITKHSRFTLTYNNANQPLVNQDHIYFKISRDTSVANDFAGTVTVAAYEVIYQSKGFPSSN